MTWFREKIIHILVQKMSEIMLSNRGLKNVQAIFCIRGHKWIHNVISTSHHISLILCRSVSLVLKYMQDLHCSARLLNWSRRNSFIANAMPAHTHSKDVGSQNCFFYDHMFRKVSSLHSELTIAWGL